MTIALIIEAANNINNVRVSLASQSQDIGHCIRQISSSVQVGDNRSHVCFLFKGVHTIKISGH